MCILACSRPGHALGHGENVHIVHPDVEKGRRAERDDGRADVGVGDDLDAEDVGDGAPRNWGWVRGQLGRRERKDVAHLRSVRNNREIRT